MVKNHYKCTEIIGMAEVLLGLEAKESLGLAWILMRNVQRDLKNGAESAQKELTTKGEDAMVRHLLHSFEDELHQIKEIQRECSECLCERGVNLA